MKEELRERLISLQSFKTEGEYRESPSLNYSTLKLIPDGPKCLVAEHFEKKGPALTIGDYVDKFFTDRELWRATYDTERRSIKLSESLETLYSSFVASREYHPLISECIARSRELGLWSSFSDGSLSGRITPDFFEKLKMAEKAESKVMLTQAEYDKAMNSIGNIRQCKVAMDLISEDENSIIIPQFKWEFEIQLASGVKRKFRVMFDFLKFIISEKRIIGIDIKSGSVVSIKFGNQFVEFRYDVQGILYYMGMLAFQKQYLPDWETPTLGDFKFLYSPKVTDSPPVIVSMSEDFLQKTNTRVNYGGKSIVGFWEILDDADWYLNNQEFERHRLIAENDHQINIMQLLQ